MLPLSFRARSLALLLIVSLAVTNFVSIAPIAAAESAVVLSPTVKVRSYDLTKSGQAADQGWGSGTLISRSGLILTNNHVVTDQYEDPYEALSICMVTDAKERPTCLYTASVIARDKSRDLAILQLSPKDIYGEGLPTFPTLDYSGAKLPSTGDAITAYGFPGIGGETETTTTGKITGYEEREGIKLLKVDATISFGNSGGTATDSLGNFIGIPAAIQSDAASLGYVIPLSEVTDWIDDNLEATYQPDAYALGIIGGRAKIEEKVYTERAFTAGTFPHFALSVPKPWRVSAAAANELAITNGIAGHDVTLILWTETLPYDATDELLQYRMEKREKNYHLYVNYKREKTTVSGVEGYLIHYDRSDDRVYRFTAAIGNTLFNYQYLLPLNDTKEAEQGIKAILDTLTLADAGTQPGSQAFRTYTQKRPAFSIRTAGSKRVLPHYDGADTEAIVSIETPDSFDQDFVIAERYLPLNYQNVPLNKLMEDVLKQSAYQYDSFKLVNSYSDVTLDGLKGFGFVFRYQGDDANQTREGLEMWFPTDKYYLHITYSDLESNYVKDIDAVRDTLQSISYGTKREGKGTYDIPLLKARYRDLDNYLYEEKITKLVDKGLITAPGALFRPETQETRLEALTAIWKSKVFVEDGRNQETTSKLLAATDISTLPFQDADLTDADKRALALAVQKGAVGSSESFGANDGVTLAAALKMLCRVYELPVWSPPYDVPWYAPYMQQGYALGVIPPDAVAPDTVLTRGQFAALLSEFASRVGERSDI